MSATRREFLRCATAAVTMGVPLGLLRPDRLRPAVAPSRRWVLLGLGEGCYLRESAGGYASALAGVGVPLVRAEADSVPRCAALIVPGALTIPSPALQAIVTCLRAGASVILESAAGFADGPQFRAHRAALRDQLALEIEPPVQLWPARGGSRGTPYVDYTWPYPAKIRDFSRVVPLGQQAGEVIAWAEGLPVALKRRWERGTLVFLGSPVGPALWAGDVEAKRWAVAVLARGGRP